MDWPQRQEIVAALSDLRLRQLGRRLVAFYSPQLLSTEERVQFEAWLRERWSAPDAPEIEWMAVASARRAVDELRGNDGVDQALIGEIEVYLQGFDIKAN